MHCNSAVPAARLSTTTALFSNRPKRAPVILERIVLALPPDHPLATLEEVELTKIRNERLLFLREGHCFRESALTACRKARIAGNAVFESDQFASIFALVAAGSGISLLPEMAASAAVGCRIVPLLPHSFRRIGYAYVRRQFTPPAQKAFVQGLKSPLYSLRPALRRPPGGGASR